MGIYRPNRADVTYTPYYWSSAGGHVFGRRKVRVARITNQYGQCAPKGFDGSSTKYTYLYSKEYLSNKGPSVVATLSTRTALTVKR